MKEGGVAILNGDDDKLSTKKEVNGRLAVFYGIGEHSSFYPENGLLTETGCTKSVYATEVENLGLEGMKATIHTPKGEMKVHISIPGEHNVYNALAATAVGLELGLSLDEVKKGIEEARTIAGRTNLVKVNGMNIIDDCYNANPVSMAAALDVLSHATGRTIAVLGDMGELGENEKALHYGVGVCVGEKKIHTLFCAGELAAEYEKGTKSVNTDCEVYYFKTRDEMIASLKEYVKAGDNILIKASHFMDFPKVVEVLSNSN
jgi:UDP-N-acetylmuramoyl-tripeptide--D-alanyl-D-alanine ligase